MDLDKCMIRYVILLYSIASIAELNEVCADSREVSDVCIAPNQSASEPPLQPFLILQPFCLQIS